jgi:long-chain alkane monooxygenase
MANRIAGMKQYREDVRAHAVKFGRNPDGIPGYPFLGETNGEAKAKYQRLIASDSFIHVALAAVGQITDIDFSRVSLDQPLPRIATNGEQGSLDKFAQWGTNKTLRQLASERFDSGLDLIGTPGTWPSAWARRWKRSMAMVF